MATAPDLAIIGGGTMGRAILEGGVRAGVLDPARVVVAEPDSGKRPAIEALGVQVRPGATQALEWLDEHGGGLLLLAVKPQTLAELGREIGPRLGQSPRPVLSILAGASRARVREALGGKVSVVRAMPNTPARIGQGVTALAGDGPELDFAERLFGAMGLVVGIDERLMDAFTALGASGPAYVFYLAAAMEKAGVSAGFDEATARRVAYATVAGAGALLSASGDDAATLIAGVKSKGGTTEAALNVLESEGVRGAVERAILAARDRGAELGRT